MTGIALVLSLPIVTAEKDLVLRPVPFAGLVGETHSDLANGSSYEVDATLDEGEIDGVPWSLRASERPDAFCFSFLDGLTAGERSRALVCTTPPIAEVGPSQFIPASEDLQRSIFVAALPAKIEELRLGATDDAPLQGGLYELPSLFEADAFVLAVFLPPGTDLTYAAATDQQGRRVDVSRIVDQVDAY